MDHNPGMAKKTNKLANPALQASWFERVREAHQTETAEDYVELIADLIKANGEARVSDLSERFGVSHSTVNKTVNRLNRDGLVTNRPYRSLFLTERGEDLAAYCKQRHKTVLAFLMALGIPREIAEYDAEGIEHHVSKETLEAFKAYTNSKEER